MAVLPDLRCPLDFVKSGLRRQRPDPPVPACHALAYCQGKLTETDYGRDHHPRCFTIWMAGGGIKPGMTYGETDDFSYNIAADPVHVHDLHATILHSLGVGSYPPHIRVPRQRP